MSGSFVYRSPTTPAGAGWAEDLGDQAVRLGKIGGLSTQAQLGAVDGSSIPLDDPLSDIGHASDGIVGLKQFDWREGACPVGRRVIFTGYVGPRTYRRGDSERSSLITGAARWIDVNLQDINAFLSFRLLVDWGSSGDASFNRPAETDIERVQALLDVYYLTTTLFDGLVTASSPVDMDAVDYTGQRPIDVLNDCAQASGRNFFVFYDEAGTYCPSAGDFGLFYDFDYAPVYPANDPDFRVSNVLTDCDRTGGEFTGPTWPPSMDAELEVDPMRVVTAASTTVGKTAVSRELITTSYKFAHRDMDVATPDLKTVAKAEARLDRYLDDNSTEDARLTFRMRLPAANVNDWKEGQYASVRFSHLRTDALDLATDFVRVRCVRRTVSQDEETDAFYNVDYECTPLRGEPSGAADSGLVGVSYSGTPTLPRPTTPGNVLLAIMFASGNTTRFPTAFRALDNPPVSPASPATPPFSALQTAAWTIIGKATTDYSGQSTGGPCGVAYQGPFHGAAGTCTGGMLVAAAWRHVASGEITTKPAQFSTEITDSQTTTYLWELPTTTPPDGTFVESDGTGGGSAPSTATLPTISGNVVAAIHWAFAAGHGATTQPLSPSIVSGTNLRGPMKVAPGAHSPTGMNDTTVNSNTSSWGWLLALPSGGVASARVTASAAGGGYNFVNWCGIAIRLPPGVTLPDIPYPGNQSA
jgi:hypothetical protein